jgi:hypothetical protein
MITSPAHAQSAAALSRPGKTPARPISAAFRRPVADIRLGRIALCAGLFAALAAAWPAIAQTRPAPRPEAVAASDAPAAISRADDPAPVGVPDARDAAWPDGVSDAAVPPPPRPGSLSQPAPAAETASPPADDPPAPVAAAPAPDAETAAPRMAETTPDDAAAAATVPPEDAADIGAASVPLAEQRPQPRPGAAPAAGDTPAPVIVAAPEPPAAADPPAPAIRTVGPVAAPVSGKTPTAGGAAPGLIEPEPVRPGGGAGTLSLRALCGNPRIIGRGEETIRVNMRGCGVSAPVRVWEVDGIRLDPPALIDCPTAGALFEWVDRDLRPVFRDTGGGLAGISVASAYACPAQFGPPAGRGHLHAVGKALDLSAFTLDDGTRISVFAGWDSPAWGALLDEAADRACGIFEMVLTPRAEAGERNSIHLDTGRVLDGPYCR